MLTRCHGFKINIDFKCYIFVFLFIVFRLYLFCVFVIFILIYSCFVVVAVVVPRYITTCIGILGDCRFFHVKCKC